MSSVPVIFQVGVVVLISVSITNVCPGVVKLVGCTPVESGFDHQLFRSVASSLPSEWEEYHNDDETPLIITVVVYTVDGVQPEPLTVNEYVVVTTGFAVGFCSVELKPPGPLQDHAVAPVEFAVKVTGPPEVTGPLFVGAAVGLAFTETVVVYAVDGLQPGPLALTVNEYVVVTVGVAVGFCAVELKPPAAVHDHEVAPVEFAFKVAVPPAQIVPLFVGAAVGTELTVTAVVYTVPGLHPGLPLPSVTVKEYVVVTVGVAVGFCKVELKLPGPVHDQVAAPVEFAFKVTVPPAHTVPLFVGAATGTAFTVTTVVYTVPGEQLALLTVNE